MVLIVVGDRGGGGSGGGVGVGIDR